MSKAPFCLSLLAALLLPPFSRAQDPQQDPENFHLEVMGSAWLLNAGGQIQSSGTPADFVNDLRVFQHNTTFYGQLVFKPGRRHRISVEGSPIGLNGRNSLDRQIVYRGQTFSIDQTVTSRASLDYLFAGYQYDVLSGRKGHLGFSVGAAYLNATGTLEAESNSALASATVTTTASKNQKVVLPLAGFDFRFFPVPGHSILEIEGGMRGMAFGDYGYYAQAIGQGGVSLGHVALLAGYRAVNTSIYVTSNGSPSGLTARLQGPIFSALFRW